MKEEMKYDLKKLTLNGLEVIADLGSEGGYVIYNDGVTVDIYESNENLNDITEYLDDNNIAYEVRCEQTDEVYNENYHKECKDNEDYDNSFHRGWKIKIIK